MVMAFYAHSHALIRMQAIDQHIDRCPGIYLATRPPFLRMGIVRGSRVVPPESRILYTFTALVKGSGLTRSILEPMAMEVWCGRRPSNLEGRRGVCR